MDIAVIIFCFIIMLVGLVGTIMPVVPGIPIIWAAIMGYGFYSGWLNYGLVSMIITGFLVILSVMLDQLASIVGAKKFGASRAGMIGSVAGAIIGLIILNIIGLIIGTFLGAVICEMAFSQRDFKEAMSSGAGALLGFLAGSLFKFMLGMGLIGFFLYAVIF